MTKDEKEARAIIKWFFLTVCGLLCLVFGGVLGCCLHRWVSYYWY